MSLKEILQNCNNNNVKKDNSGLQSLGDQVFIELLPFDASTLEMITKEAVMDT